MAATVWKGHITFGLVSIPVRLFRAARPERVKLRQLYRRSPSVASEAEPEDDGAAAETETRLPVTNARPSEDERAPEPVVAPVQRVYQDASGQDASGGERTIERSDLVKGYEYDKGQYVVVSEEDIRSLVPQTSTEMEIVQFVHFTEIDPVYLETSYYVAPDQNGEKAYALLFESMRSTSYAAIGHVSMHRRDHVMILRPGKSGLIAHTMFYPDEVRTVEEFRTDTSLVQPKELNLAKTLIEALAKPFEPDQFKSAFRERLRELIDARVAGRQVAKVDQPPRAPVIDILAALERSLANTKSGLPKAEPQPASTQRKPAAGERAAEKRQSRSSKRS